MLFKKVTRVLWWQFWK